MNNLNHEFGLDLKLKLDSYRKKLGCFFFALSSPELLRGEKKKHNVPEVGPWISE